MRVNYVSSLVLVAFLSFFFMKIIPVFLQVRLFQDFTKFACVVFQAAGENTTCENNFIKGNILTEQVKGMLSVTISSLIKMTQ